MADKKITQLTALGAAPDTADILAIVDDPGGTPVTKKVTVANLLAALDKTAGNLDDYDFDDNAIFGYSASVNAQTGTTYPLAASDNGKVVTCENASAIAVTLNNGLPAGFTCTIIQKGAGQVTISGTATLNHRLSHTKTAGQYSAVSVIQIVDDTTDIYVLSGDSA